MAVCLRRDRGVVRHQDDRGALGAGQVEELLEDGGGVGAVQGAGRLVREDDGGAVDQGPRDGDALALAAGDLRGAAAAQLAEPEPFEDGARGGEGGLLALPGEAQRQGGVLLDGQLRQQLAVLEDESEAFAAQCADLFVAEVTERPSFETYLPALGGKHPGQAVQERGLAGTALTGDGGDLAGGDGEVGVTDGELIAVGEVDSRGGEDR